MKCKFFLLAVPLFLLAVAGCADETVNTKKIVVAYGDSITQGAFLKSPNERWANLIEAQSKSTLQIVNEGKGGRPTNSLSEFEEMMKRQPKMDLLVIALGGNDARDISSKCVPNALKNITAMIHRARETYGAKLPILLVAPTNINKEALGATNPIGKEREANLVAMNAAYPELAKTENCAFVSTYGVVPDASLTHDGVHPDAVGHVEIAKVMLPAIVQAAGVVLPQ
jgi:acyl-CoA thioesterase-1